MFNFKNRFTESDKKNIREIIRNSYNHTAFNNEPSVYEIEKFDLLFTFSIYEGNFQTSLVKLSDCHFLSDPTTESESTPATIYAGVFNFNEGYDHFVFDEFITKKNEEAVAYFHEELCHMFLNLAVYVAEQIENMQ